MKQPTKGRDLRNIRYCGSRNQWVSGCHHQGETAKNYLQAFTSLILKILSPPEVSVGLDWGPCLRLDWPSLHGCICKEEYFPKAKQDQKRRFEGAGWASKAPEAFSYLPHWTARGSFISLSPGHGSVPGYSRCWPWAMVDTAKSMDLGCGQAVLSNTTWQNQMR